MMFEHENNLNPESAPAEREPERTTPEIVAEPPPVAPTNWHSEAGRKGARRRHQLIQEGRLYEKEHGLKSGRQRLRQLVELGRQYEREHGLAAAQKGRSRLGRVERQEVLATFLKCLVRLAKPSFREELRRLVAVLEGSDGQTA